MKKNLTIKHLLFLLALSLMLSCSKSADEVTPAALTGKWKHNGITGKITITDNGKSATQEISEPADNTITEFKADGTAIIDGDAVTYKTSGSILTISGGGQSIDFTAKVSGNNLTLSFTKDQFFNYLGNDPDYQSLLALKASITAFEYNINFIRQ